MSIKEFDRSGQRKNLKRMRKKMRMALGGRAGLVKEWGLSAKIYDAKPWRQ
jgi:hypothetical protein